MPSRRSRRLAGLGVSPACSPPATPPNSPIHNPATPPCRTPPVNSPVVYVPRKRGFKLPPSKLSLDLQADHIVASLVDLELSGLLVSGSLPPPSDLHAEIVRALVNVHTSRKHAHYQ